MGQKVSITAVIPTIGNNDFLIDSIMSIINQKKPFNEIVVFDNSQDKSLKKSIPKSVLERVKWVSSNVRLPCYESWNQAVNNASKSHVFVMGDDDIALENLSEICFDIAKENDCALLKGFIIDSQGKRIGKLPYYINNIEIGIEVAPILECLKFVTFSKSKEPQISHLTFKLAFILKKFIIKFYIKRN